MITLSFHTPVEGLSQTLIRDCRVGVLCSPCADVKKEVRFPATDPLLTGPRFGVLYVHYRPHPFARQLEQFFA